MMTEDQIAARCRVLEGEITANEEENWHMQNELDDLYLQLDEMMGNE